MQLKLEASKGSCFIIPMKAFDVIKNLPDGEVIIDADGKNIVTIKTKAIKNKYQSYPPEEFSFDITEDLEMCIRDRCEESLLELNIKAQKATDIVDALSDSVIKHDDAVCKRNSVAHFAEQEKELPVYEERKQHIDKRLTELYQERSKEMCIRDSLITFSYRR